MITIYDKNDRCNQIDDRYTPLNKNIMRNMIKTFSTNSNVEINNGLQMRQSDKIIQLRGVFLD